MDTIAADDLQAIIFGRGPDFVNGIDNEALDFSQLEDFINSEGSQSNNTYFSESLNPSPSTVPPPPPPTAPPPPTPSGKLLNVIVDSSKLRPPLIHHHLHPHHHPHLHPFVRHSLPESPPDSSSEHPYSPQDEQQAVAPSAGSQANVGAIYTQLTGAGAPTALYNGGLMLSSLVVNEGGQAGAVNGTNEGEIDDLVIGGGEVMLEGGYTSLEGGGLCPSENVYTNLQNVNKKRKLSADSGSHVKSEPEHCATGQLSPQGPLSAPLDDEYASSEACLSESQYQCIRFNAFQQPQWHVLCDQNLTELPSPHYRVDADKGFNFSNADDAFVCQKKNHFQITCHVQLMGDAQFVKTPDGFQKISSFHIHFYGVKHDCPTQTIRVEQSQSDRSKKPFHPVLIELVSTQVTKLTVGRLHFSETTSNNMRKKGKPNPEQRYFQLVVGLHAHTASGNVPIVSHASQKIIVRASNPGQFESDVELCWQKGQTPDSICHSGRVGVNNDRPDESLVVHGNIKVTGHIIQPSDVRAKKNIVECDSSQQLRNVKRLRVVRYEYEPHFAKELRRDCFRSDTGVIAQEVAEVLPEAVRAAGDLVLGNGVSIENFLVVNKERIFMENVGAVKELCKVTDNLETRIDQLERMNQRLNRLKRGDSLKSAKLEAMKKMKGDENTGQFCSNKFIQVVIVVLVFIMAFCLAAITTLYLMEASRHSQLAQSVSFQAPRAPTAPTKRPSKPTKPYALRSPRPPADRPLKAPDSPPVEGAARLRPAIGRPADCLRVDQNLEASHLCHIFCCGGQLPPAAPPDLQGLYYANRAANGSEAVTVRPPAGGRFDDDKAIGSGFHSNDIEKQGGGRQRRDAFDLPNDEVNSFDSNDDPIFLIIIQGRSFNTTLTRRYLLAENGPNYTYYVPISKYMADEFVNLIFRSKQALVRDVEYCWNGGTASGCKSEERVVGGRHKVNEQTPSLLISTLSTVFEVDMADFQSKMMTYRASLRPGQGVCKQSKPDAEFIEYNFHFYRHCDE